MHFLFTANLCHNSVLDLLLGNHYPLHWERKFLIGSTRFLQAFIRFIITQYSKLGLLFCCTNTPRKKFFHFVKITALANLVCCIVLLAKSLTQLDLII